MRNLTQFHTRARRLCTAALGRLAWLALALPVLLALAPAGNASASAAVTVAKAGTGSGTVTGSPGAIDCGATCTDVLADGATLTLVATPAPGSRFMGWLGPCTGQGTCQFTVDAAATALATFAPEAVGPATLDIDGDNEYTASTDGVLILRYLFGLTGDALTSGVIGNEATRTTPDAVIAYLINVLPALDIDGNGQVTALTDGLMIFRYLSGLRGTTLLTGVLGSGATRMTAGDIEDWIAGVNLPPDPAMSAPPLDPGVTTGMLAATAFLYSGPDAVQTGVVPGTIEPKRVAVIRGKVFDRSGAPLAGAKVSILRHPEFGFTVSRGDGGYDIALNGGGKLIVRVQKSGYFEVQRDVIVPWQDYVHAPDVVLTQPDSAASIVDLAQGAPQVARANTVTDARGSRRATLIVLPGTTAQFRMPNGTLQPAPTTLTVRQTEYTVGALGPASMPSELPPTSGYTYYLELTADEELAAGAIGVEFNQPVVFYLENFVGFPVGAHAPVGFYDRQAGVWKGEPDGRVVKVLSVNGGFAELDTNGDAVADNGVGTGQNGANLGITSTERQQLAGLYAAGQTLWRVETNHFSPGDINWPYGPPDDAVPPNGGPPTNEEPDKSPCDCSPCKVGGSIIECGNQTLGESIPIVGTGLSLNYRSDRVPGRIAANKINIPITGATVPGSLEAASLEVMVAGQRHTQSFSAATSQSTTYQWNGHDGYGRAVQGAQKARVRVGFQYQAVFQATPVAYYRSWALASGNPTGITASGKAILYRDHDIWLGGWDARGQGLGGWTLSSHHAYDYRNRVLYLGTGERRRDVDGLAPVVGTIAGNGISGVPVDGANALQSSIYPQFSGLAIEPDGSVLFSNSGNYGSARLWRLRPNGTMQRIGGLSVPAPFFGVPASSANLTNIDKHAVGPDGSIYLTYRSRAVVARIRPGDQIVELFAGTLDQPGFSGDGGPATAAQLDQPQDIVVGSDGSVYVHDSVNARIRKIGPDGIINTIAGAGAACTPADDQNPQCTTDGPALEKRIGRGGGENYLSIAPDGTLYALRNTGFSSNQELYRIGNDGVLRIVGSKRGRIPSGVYLTAEGVLALDASLVPISAMTVGPDGLVYFAYTYSFSQKVEIRYIDLEGRIRILAGSSVGYGGDGGPARSAKFASQPSALAFGPQGELVIADMPNYRLRRLESRFPGYTGASDFLIPSADGAVAYRFDPNGRHLQTLHGLTGAALSTFGYDGQGRLATITDGDNNVVTIQRNGSGAPTAIVAPFGQLTQLTSDGNGWLSQVKNPANETVGLVHQANGLLTTMTTPKGQSYAFAYDPATGHLMNDADPAGGSQALAGVNLPPDATRLSGHDVTKTTGLGRLTKYQTERLRTGERVETATDTDGTQRTMSYAASGARTTQYASSSEKAESLGADPRWGMLAPIVASANVAMPSGKTLTLTDSMAVTLSDPANVFALTQLTSTSTINGRAFVNVYAGATRQLTQTSPMGRVGTTTIDVLGRPVSDQFGGLAATTLSYDSRGRLSSMTSGTGAEARTTTYAYNAQGHLQSVTDPAGRVTSFAHDAAGRTTGWTLPDGRVVALTYDANGKIATVLPPGRPAHAFSRSAVDLDTKYDPPDVAGVVPDATDLTYNTDRQLVQSSRADGRTIVRGFDSAGRLNSVAYSRGSLGLSYHATTGKPNGLTAPDGVGHALSFDGELLTSHTLTGPVPGVVAWTYDNDFRVVSQSVNGANTVSFVYDNDSLLTQAGALTLNRNAQNGLRIGTALGAVTDAWTYNTHGEPVDYQASVSGSLLYRTQLTRDALGRVVQKIETLGAITDTYNYGYDLAGRLIAADRNGQPVTYSHDSNSNRTGTNGPLGSVAGASYDAQDRLLQYGTAAYAYTKDGELSTRTQAGGSTQYTYDEFGNLTRVVLPGGTQIDYVIDGMNRRVGKKVDGILVKRWLYEGKLRIVAELDGAGTLISRFVYAGKTNVPEYVVQGGVTYRLVTDHLGSPRYLIDTATGSIAGSMNHDAYGRIIQDSLSALIPFGFAGGQYDSQTALVRFGARDYDSETGRWTARDPLLFGGMQENLYVYAGAAPTHYVDPTGLNPLWEVVKNTGKDVAEETAEGVVNGEKPSEYGPGKFVENGLEALVTKNPVGEVTVGTVKVGVNTYSSDKFYFFEQQYLYQVEIDCMEDLGTRLLARRLRKSLQSNTRHDAPGIIEWQQRNAIPIGVLRQRTIR